MCIYCQVTLYFIKITNALLHPVKTTQKVVNKAAIDLIGKAKWLARGIYTLAPSALYAATTQKVVEIEALSWFPRLIAKIFFRDDLNRLYEAHGAAAKGMGAAGAYLTTAFTDDLIGRVVQRGGKRRALEIGVTGALASAVHAGSEAFQAGNLDTFFQNYSSLEGAIQNVSETGMNLYQIMSYHGGGDGQNMLKGMAAGLAGLALWKTGEIVVPYLARMKDRFVSRKAYKRAEKAYKAEMEA